MSGAAATRILYWISLERRIDMEELTAQHCLTIAAAFIAIIAACATLINSANSKAESLASRIREAAKEHRERKNSSRCHQLQEQIRLFRERFQRVQQAQRLLFSTIGIFITSLAVFIVLGLYITYSNVPIDRVPVISRLPIFIIGVCVTVGSVLMLAAIYFQLLEIGKSYITLCIETKDCDPNDGIDEPSVSLPELAA